MGRLKSDLQNKLYGNQIKTELQSGENLIFQNSIAYYQEPKASTAFRAVIGITNRRVIIEPTMRPNDVISLFYYDIQSITEEVYQGFRIGRKPAVIHITRKDNVHYYLYSYSTDNNETRNMLLTIQNALNNSGQ